MVSLGRGLPRIFIVILAGQLGLLVDASLVTSLGDPDYLFVLFFSKISIGSPTSFGEETVNPGGDLRHSGNTSYKSGSPGTKSPP